MCQLVLLLLLVLKFHSDPFLIMKKFLQLATLLAVTLSFSSCCSMFSGLAPARYRTEKVKACGYDTITQEVPVAGSKDGLTQTVTTKIPRYKTVKHVVYCGSCTRYYCPDKGCCGTTGPGTRKMASTQSGGGSPNLGLIPTMKPLAP